MLHREITWLMVLVLSCGLLIACEGSSDGSSADAAVSDSADPSDSGPAGLCTAYCQFIDGCGSLVGDCDGECNTYMESATEECKAAYQAWSACKLSAGCDGGDACSELEITELCPGLG